MHPTNDVQLICRVIMSMEVQKLFAGDHLINNTSHEHIPDMIIAQIKICNQFIQNLS